MGNSTLDDRGRALEEQFFAKQNQAVIDKMQAENEKKQQRKALSDASGIDDEGTLDALLAAGVHAEALSALSILPLIFVAWADGKMEAKELEAIHKAATELGFERTEANHELLDYWLANPPPASMMDAWKQYVSALLAQLDDAQSQKLEAELLNHAQSVAESAGGFLGFGNKVSSEEQAVLDMLHGCF